MGVWNNIAVGQSGKLLVAVECEQSNPSRWQLNVTTPMVHVWLGLPDHAAVHQLLRFIEQTNRREGYDVRPEMTVGTFCGRAVRFVRNDEDDRYYVTLGPLDDDRSEESVFLWLEPEQIDALAECLRQVVRALDGREERS